LEGQQRVKICQTSANSPDLEIPPQITLTKFFEGSLLLLGLSVEIRGGKDGGSCLPRPRSTTRNLRENIPRIESLETLKILQI